MGGIKGLPNRERFERKVDRRGGPSSCHLWTAARNADGYGKFAMRGAWVFAHRWAWEQEHAEALPRETLVLHRCDNPRCVNVEHLFLGTDKVNSDDKRDKGRRRDVKGEANGSAKLSDEDVREIRELGGEVSQEAVGVAFGVHQFTVSQILRRKTWKHVA